MSETETLPPRRLGRSIGAVLTGIFAGIVLTIGTDISLHASGVFPPLTQQPPMSFCLPPPIALSTALLAATSLPCSRLIGPCSTPWSAASWAWS